MDFSWGFRKCKVCHKNIRNGYDSSFCRKHELEYFEWLKKQERAKQAGFEDYDEYIKSVKRKNQGGYL